jgi:hypothetical protein
MSALCATLGAYAQGPCPQEISDVPIKFSQRLLLAESADLDQCANGAVGGTPVQCTGQAWQNGNLCRNGAHYLEGESVPYRMKFSGLTPGNSYTVTIEWDTTENSGAKHALDYLTNFDETEISADPCSGVAGCSLSNQTTYAIPMDPKVAMGHDGVLGTPDDVVQKPGVFTLFSGTITGVSGYTMTGTYGGASQTQITITFTADEANPVLAWGGHISTRLDWGFDNSAIAISGSPYHMRLIDLNGSGGNQDRSLSSDATVFPGSLTIIKQATPLSSVAFTFTATGPGVSNFSLVDDGSGVGNSQLFAGLTEFGSANGITVTEGAPTNSYRLGSISCVEFAAGGSGEQNSTVSVSSRTANIVLEEGEVVTCTFVNQVVTAADALVSGRVTDELGAPIRASLILTDLSTGVNSYSRTNSFGNYQFSEIETGREYMLRVFAKAYVFADDSRILVVRDDLTNIDFVGRLR